MGFKTGEPYKPLFSAVSGVVSDPNQAGSGTSQPSGISGETRRGNEKSPACPAREATSHSQNCSVASPEATNDPRPHRSEAATDKTLKNVDGIFPTSRSTREAVRAMFSRIARRYDLINRTLSLGMDKWVRRKAAALAIPLVRGRRSGSSQAVAWPAFDGLTPTRDGRLARGRASLRYLQRNLANARPNDLVLDLCTGTAAMALELARQSARVIGVDFSSEMLAEARKKCAHTKIKLIAADAKSLPFRCGPSEAGPSGPFDLVTVAFGLRNMGDVKESLGSIKRALRPGGRVLILEFGMPQNRLIRFFYRIYIRLFLPLIGGLLSGEKEAYKYLARSIFNFSQNHNLNKALKKSGFREVRSFPLASGIAVVYLAKKT